MSDHVWSWQHLGPSQRKYSHCYLQTRDVAILCDAQMEKRAPKICLCTCTFLINGNTQWQLCRFEAVMKALFIKKHPIIVKRQESWSTKATNGSWKCDTVEKNRFDSVLMDNFSVWLHPLGASMLCSVFTVSYSLSLPLALFFALTDTHISLKKIMDAVCEIWHWFNRF